MLSDDRPITAHDQDRFGFDQIGGNLADAIKGLPAGMGLTIGVEGRWGSGKTSLTNLLVERFRKECAQDIRVFKFSPWLFQSPADYPVEFLRALASEIDKAPVKSTTTEKAYGGITNWLRGRSKTRVLSLADKVRQYAAHVLGFASTIMSKGKPLSFKVAAAAEIAKAGEKALNALKFAESADAQKASIITELRREAHRYVVVMDDLDRLEPAEGLEVMRLVRSIADFPNVIYVLCYDRIALSRAIEVGLGIDNGETYLEKIIQLSFALPRPETFDLRDWCLTELMSVYKQAVDDTPDRDLTTRLRSALDFYAPQMTSPRQVRRLINAVAFHFSPVAQHTFVRP